MTVVRGGCGCTTSSSRTRHQNSVYPFQITILQQTEAAPTQLHPNSWAMMQGFEIMWEYLEVRLLPDVFIFLFTLTHLASGGLTTSWLSFRAHTNRKVFLLYEESFHHFKLVFFKVFGAPGSIPLWGTLESKLQFNCFWCKHISASWVEESNLKPKEQAIPQFFLQCFEKNHLNLKNLVGVDLREARRYLGLYPCFC